MVEGLDLKTVLHYILANWLEPRTLVELRCASGRTANHLIKDLLEARRERYVSHEISTSQISFNNAPLSKTCCRSFARLLPCLSSHTFS